MSGKSEQKYTYKYIWFYFAYLGHLLMNALNFDQKYTNSFLNFKLHVNEYGDLEV